MDVTCERCGTEYLFDETLVSERGTAVKCTNCGNLFKVYRPGAGPEAARPWLVRRTDGTSERLESLRDLQRRISEGALSAEDLISRTGDDWKRLGDIAELTSFFETAQQAARKAKRERDNTASGMGGPPFQPSPSARPPAASDARAYAPTVFDSPAGAPPAARGQTKMGVGEAQPPLEQDGRAGTIRGLGTQPSTPPPSADSSRGSTRQGMSAPPPRAPAPVSQPPVALRAPTRPGHSSPEPPPRMIPQTAFMSAEDLHAPAAATAPIGRRRGPPPRAEAVTQEDSMRPPARPAPRIDDDEAEIGGLPRRGGSRAPWIVLAVVVLLGGAGVAAWRFAPELGLVHADDPTAPFLARGDAALARDDDESYDAAQLEYTKALAFRDRDVRVLTALARAHAVWAQALAFDATDLEARAATDAALHGQATRTQQESRAHAQDALRYAENAARQSPADADAEVAVADAMRLTGDGISARAHFDRARAIRVEQTAEDLRVGALLAMSEAQGNVAAAKDLAAAAVTKDGALLRARLLLARALLASGDVSGARVQIDTVLAHDARHPRALALRDAIDRGLPPAAPVVAIPDAGTAAVPSEGVDAGVDLGSPGVPANVAGGGGGGGAGGGGGGGGAAPGGHDYDWYVARGDELMERERPGEARSYYSAALAQRPDGREAVTGMGYVALDQADYQGAIARFRGPASGGYGEALIGLGQAYRDMNRKDDALAVYEQYVATLPNGPRAGMARHWVTVLREAGAGTATGDHGHETPPPGGGEPGHETPPPGGGEPGHEAPPTSGHELPAPNGATTGGAQSDTPAIGTER